MQMPCKVADKAESKLIEAIEKADLIELEKLLDSGLDANRSNEVCTPLMVAVAFNNVDAVEMLLLNGANADAYIFVDGIKHDALEQALVVRNVDIIKLLVEEGAKIRGKHKLMSRCSDEMFDLINSLSFGEQY